MSVMHTFPANGEYVFAVALHASPTGQLYGSGAPFTEKIEFSVNGERVALHRHRPRACRRPIRTAWKSRRRRFRCKAGAQRVAAAFVRTFDGPANDNLAPIGHSIADTQIGMQSAITNCRTFRTDRRARTVQSDGRVGDGEPQADLHLPSDVAPTKRVRAPTKIVDDLGERGVSPAARRRATRKRSWRSTTPARARGRLRDAAFARRSRRFSPARTSSSASRKRRATRSRASTYAISNVDLASRLSFFLWGAPPDDDADRRSRDDGQAVRSGGARGADACACSPTRAPRRSATRFAAQWLRLAGHREGASGRESVSGLPPAARRRDAAARRRLFFNSIVRENKSVLDLFSANYTYVNEDLAKHYGIPGVIGSEFRTVTYPDDKRRGLLGQASILTLTSHANRTSPVLRGKWVMEVLLGSPPPPPPPNVPDLEKTGDAKDGRLLTTRERMEEHRANPQCKSCHLYMDPIGLALDNFDVTGQWRIRENGAPLDTRGELYDGTPITNLAELQQALLQASDAAHPHVHAESDGVRARPPRRVLRRPDGSPHRRRRGAGRIPHVGLHPWRREERRVPHERVPAASAADQHEVVQRMRIVIRMEI